MIFERLSADSPSTLNSLPGSKGRIGGGYGGFFWRFSACDNVEVFTTEARGEEEVHGRPGTVGCVVCRLRRGARGQWAGHDRHRSARRRYAAGEPWFVRVLSYPGLGSALAWDRAVSLPADGVLSRRFDMAVADGRLTEAETRDLAAEVTASRADAG